MTRDLLENNSMNFVNLLEKSEKPKILAVLHQETSSCGRLGKMLQAMGYEIDICRPPMGQQLPDNLENHAGAIIFGGPMSANDNEEYIKREIDWIATPLKEDKPFLGICLGAQMLSKQLGGSVCANKAEFAEIGYYPIEATPKGREMLDWPQMVYQWHREGFTLPGGAELLATGTQYENQAMKVGNNAYGVQFHAELTFAMLYRWTVKGAHRFTLNGAQPRKEHIAGRLQHDADTRRWLQDFLDLWVGNCGKAAKAGAVEQTVA
jgi:GMP synthase (glutamine-hydrolysing)